MDIRDMVRGGGPFAAVAEALASFFFLFRVAVFTACLRPGQGVSCGQLSLSLTAVRTPLQ